VIIVSTSLQDRCNQLLDSGHTVGANFGWNFLAKFRPGKFSTDALGCGDIKNVGKIANELDTRFRQVNPVPSK
jgi:hypothetical protein